MQSKVRASLKWPVWTHTHAGRPIGEEGGWILKRSSGHSFPLPRVGSSQRPAHKKSHGKELYCQQNPDPPVIYNSNTYSFSDISATSCSLSLAENRRNNQKRKHFSMWNVSGPIFMITDEKIRFTRTAWCQPAIAVGVGRQALWQHNRCWPQVVWVPQVRVKRRRLNWCAPWGATEAS